MELLLLIRPDLPGERGDIIAARPDGFLVGKTERYIPSCAVSIPIRAVQSSVRAS